MGTANASFLSSLLPTYTLSGKITNQNQEPLEGVGVTLAYDGIGGQIRTVTDSLGNYVLHPTAKASGILTMNKDGYRILRNKVSQYNYQGTTAVWNYNLHPNWVSGKITDQNGNPLEGVKITFEQNGGVTGVQTVFTDEDGNYKYTAPADSVSYWVTITKEGYTTLRDQWHYLYGGQFHNFTLH